MISVGEGGRSPHGERGLKYRHGEDEEGGWRRSPHGERGLKSHDINHGATKLVVALLMESVD